MEKNDKKTEQNRFDLNAIDSITLEFLEIYLSSPGVSRETITIDLRSDSGMFTLIDMLNKRPDGLLEAVIYVSVAKITRRSVGELSFSHVLYADCFLSKYKAFSVDERDKHVSKRFYEH